MATTYRGREATHGGKKVRMNVTFAPKYYSMLEELSSTSGSTKADVIRDALAFRLWMQDVVEDGGTILVKRKDGQLAEVVSR